MSEEIVRAVGKFAQWKGGRAFVGKALVARLTPDPAVRVTRAAEEAAAPELSKETRAALALMPFEKGAKWFPLDLTQAKRRREFIALCRAAAGGRRK